MTIAIARLIISKQEAIQLRSYMFNIEPDMEDYHLDRQLYQIQHGLVPQYSQWPDGSYEIGITPKQCKKFEGGLPRRLQGLEFN